LFYTGANIYVEGGRTGHVPVAVQARDLAKVVLGHLGFSRWEDHHVWHPTYKELCELIGGCGFNVTRTYWAWQNSQVCYVRGIKRASAATAGLRLGSETTHLQRAAGVSR
jgi:hypothetical protein